MRHHLDLTLAEAVARLGGDYAADIAAYEQVQRQVLRLRYDLGGHREPISPAAGAGR
jgi:hypothetical protein